MTISKSFGVSLLVSLFAVLASCAGKSTSDLAKPSDLSGSRALNEVIQKYTDESKHLDPFLAPYFNLEEDLDKFGTYPDEDYFVRSKKICSDALAAVSKIDPNTLNSAEQRTYRLFKEDMEVSLEEFDFPNQYLSFNQMGNRLHAFLSESNEALTMFPFDSVKHYEAFLKRSMGFPIYVDNQIALLREGIKKKVTLSCAVVKQVPNSYKDGLEKEIEVNPFYRPITFMPKSFSEADRERLKAGFREMVRDRILPGFQKFDHFFKSEYSPHCRKGFGLYGLKNATNWYQYEIRANTNLDMDAEAIHQIGLSEVKRISGEIEKIKEQLGFHGTYKEFLKSLLENKSYFFSSSKEMFDHFLKVKSDTAAKVDQYFSLKPKSDFTIVESDNPEDASGMYNEPTEMIPHGRFIVNTKNLRAVPVYDVTTLMLHETVPGHHYQLALQFEMKDQLSEYQRKLFGSNSFVEGWALYAEYLGNEMGMFADPLQRLGNLNDEMLRAVRLVVDTGIHSEGWSPARARAYMSKYLANDPKDIATEVNRYSTWPGQALGYKLGQLKIIELRRLAEKTLGPKFNIKDFHRAVIGQGTVSLGELERQVKEWIQKVGST